MTNRVNPDGIIIFVICLLCALIWQTSSQATEIEVVYSFRALGEGWHEPAFEEGTFLTTITSTEPIFLRDPDDSFVQLGSQRFTRLFHWAETDTVSVVFVDENEEEFPLQLFPAPHFTMDPANHTVPVIHLKCDPVNLWDIDTGIYVYGMHINWSMRGEEWERPATIDYWETDGSLAFSCPVGIRINGGNSRSYQQKSFRLYFDHNDEPEQLTFDLFGNGTEEFARLIARSGMYPHQLLIDTWACSLFAEMGHEVSRSKFVNIFLNQEYWGCYYLRERLDDEWLEVTRGLDDDHFILIKDGETENGNGQIWWDFLEWVGSPQDYSAHQFFERVNTEINLASYVDWLIINIFGAPSDVGFYANMALMKVMNDPWEFVMWDEDSLLTEQNAEANMFRFYSSANQEEFNSWHPANYHIQDYQIAAPFFQLFNHLMQNAQFRTLFSNRFDELVQGPMKPRAMTERLQAIAAEKTPELLRHADKFWGGNNNLFPNALNAAVEWIPARSIVVIQQKNEFMQHFMAPVELSSFSATEVDGDHVLTWRTESEINCLGFVLQRAQNSHGPFVTFADYLTEPALVAAGGFEIPTEYSFLTPVPGPADAFWYRLVHADSDGHEVVHPWTELVGTPPAAEPLLWINEIMALNSTGITDENGEYEDWVEIYNPGTEDLDLSGMFLTDDLALTTRWEFPEGTILAPENYLIVWCDSDEEDGPLHTSFKLSGAGEQCALFTSIADGHWLVDEVVFGVQSEDVSYGRSCDGCLQWTFFTPPTPGNSNGVISGAPLPFRGDMMVLDVFPNPFNPVINIEIEGVVGQRWQVGVYGLDGRLVRVLDGGLFKEGRYSLQWEGIDDRGRGLGDGVYFLSLRGENYAVTKKITLLK